MNSAISNKPLLHIFGEVLFDHFPDGSRVLGGTPFNVAWHIVTRGEKGAVAYDRLHHFTSVQPPASTMVVDTVDAGDAFAAILLLGINKQWPLEIILERAQLFASALVSRRGATVADLKFYRTFKEQWCQLMLV